MFVALIGPQPVKLRLSDSAPAIKFKLGFVLQQVLFHIFSQGIASCDTLVSDHTLYQCDLQVAFQKSPPAISFVTRELQRLTS